MRLVALPNLGKSGQTAELLALKEAVDRTQAVIEFDPSGHVLSANANFLKAMGYGLDEVKGQHHRLFVDPDYAESEAYTQFWADLRTGQFKTGEFARKGKGGRDVFLEAAYTPILDKRGHVTKILKTAFNITARRQHDLDLEGKVSSIERAQAVIEFALDGTILRANDNFLQVMGYTAAEIVGKHHSLFVEPAEASSFDYTSFWRRLNGGEFISAQFKRVAKGGREVYIQATYNPILGADGKPVKVVKFATDVTERVLHEAEFSGQVEAISRAQGVIEFALDGTILTANDKFLKLMGYELSEIRGQGHSLFVTEAFTKTEEYAAFWQRLRRGDYVAGEFHRIAKGGRDVYIQASYNPIYDLNGKPLKVVKYCSDVTARRVALNRTTELSRSLQELSAAVEEMAVTGRSIAGTMEHTKLAADKANASVADADASARRLSEATVAMDGIVELITNITGQINLLALNATIESARAGEAGRGFAVVATEVKNLANQAKRASEQIASEISSVRAGAHSVFAALDEIRGTVEEVQSQVMFTAGAVEQQSATSQDMARNMQIASDEAENIVAVA